MILDASALLAALQAEPGADSVNAVLAEACMNTVNWSEVLQKLLRHDPQANDILADLQKTGFTVTPFTLQQAEICAQLWSLGRPLGLSFADRACLATAIDRHQPVLTADRAWQKLQLPIKIQCIR